MSEQTLTIDEETAQETRDAFRSNLDDVGLDIQSEVELTTNNTEFTLAYIIDANGNEYSIEQNVGGDNVYVFSIVDGVVFQSHDVTAVAEYINEHAH